MPAGKKRTTEEKEDVTKRLKDDVTREEPDILVSSSSYQPPLRNALKYKGVLNPSTSIPVIALYYTGKHGGFWGFGIVTTEECNSNDPDTIRILIPQ